MISKSTLALSALASVTLMASAALAESAAKGERTFTTALGGAAEVPGPGDPEGTGSATVTVSAAKKQVCYAIQVSGIGDPTAAHIHEGAAGAAGPPVVTLDPPTGEDCVDVDAAIAAKILARPAQYYVNVHTAEFPGGAVRGQLG